MKILQVNTADVGGGAEVVARQLFAAYRARGHWSRLAVGAKSSDDPDVIRLPRTGEGGIREKLTRYFGPRVSRVARDPMTAWARLLGSEDVTAPSSWSILDRLGGDRPDILHCHNLHGLDYFDLRALPALSTQLPLLLTLHDAWLLSGHCAHSLNCQRWTAGCGHCPDLTLYPAIRRDNSASNFARKRAIFKATRAYVSVPSQWLMERVRRSHLADSIIDARVMPNCVDTTLFVPGDRAQLRHELGVPPSAHVVLFVAAGGTANRWKDFETFRRSLGWLTFAQPTDRIVCLVLGEAAELPSVGRVEFRCVPTQSDPRQVVRLYQASDVYVHSARADSFPLAVLEALSCGTPIVASAVGGIPEQVLHDGAAPGDWIPDGVTPAANEHATGVLVPAGDAPALARALSYVLNDALLRARLGANARRDAVRRFSLEQVVEAWLAWYAAILETHPSRSYSAR